MTSSTSRTEPSSNADTDELEQDIQRTREEMGETVEALVDRFAGKLRPVAIAGIALAVALVVVGIVARRRRR